MGIKKNKLSRPYPRTLEIKQLKYSLRSKKATFLEKKCNIGKSVHFVYKKGWRGGRKRRRHVVHSLKIQNVNNTSFSKLVVELLEQQ